MKLLRLAHRCLVQQTMPRWAANYYERLVDAVADAYLKPFCDEVSAAFPQALRILDAGTGTGQLPVFLARARPDWHVTGVDLSVRCLELACAKAERAGVAARVSWLRASLESIPLSAASMDLVLSTLSLHHWRRPASVLRELARVLKPGGEIWLLDDAAEASRASRAEWAAEVERLSHAGLLFRCVYWFESRYLAYSKEEVAALAAAAGLTMHAHEMRGVFFLAHLRPANRPGQAEPCPIPNA
ncbi:MAG: class I SAM-dependent methyltransferase [Planctomycetota bacterium]|nr:class I SAM-dependent methyltransferase [Planctomycetota bacterium]